MGMTASRFSSACGAHLEMLERELDGSVQPLGLRLERRSARFCQAVVAAATVVEVGVGTPWRFLEEALILEASDRGVEGSGSELHRAVGLFLDGLADEVPVAVSRG